MFGKEAVMVRLYKYNEDGKLVAADYGVKSKIREYVLQGYIIVFV